MHEVNYDNEERNQLGKTLGISRPATCAMNADDFRDYMCHSIFTLSLRQLRNAAKKELDRLSYAKEGDKRTHCDLYEANATDVIDFEKQMRSRCIID